MKAIAHVMTGSVKTGGVNYELVSGAIGSCIVVTIYDSINRLGGMAHIMLPGAAPRGFWNQQTKYAENAIADLLQRMSIVPGNFHQMAICLIGGGNVLKKKDHGICSANIFSVKEIMNRMGLRVSAESLGGEERRTARFSVEKGEVYITRGDSKELLLWSGSNGTIDE